MRQEHSPWFKYICSMCQYSLSPAWGCFSTKARPLSHSNVETTLDRGKGESSNRLWAAHTEQFLRQPPGTWLLARSYINRGGCRENKQNNLIWAETARYCLCSVHELNSVVFWKELLSELSQWRRWFCWCLLLRCVWPDALIRLICWVIVLRLQQRCSIR